MAREAILWVEGMNGEEKKTEVINSFRKYPGVLDVDVNLEAGELRVRFDPANIIEDDLRDTIEESGYQAGIIKSSISNNRPS